MSEDFVVYPRDLEIDGLSGDVLGSRSGPDCLIQGGAPVTAGRLHWNAVVVSNRLQNMSAKKSEIFDLFFAGFVGNAFSLCYLGLGKFPEREVFRQPHLMHHLAWLFLEGRKSALIG